ncbi:MAG: CotH kinase family protein [Prevotella sp.]|nr:CotH kinase family protein [Prevotella sp.]
MKQIFSIFIAILALCLWTVSCTSLDEVNERIDQLENRVTNIEDALAALQRAYADGKIISSVDHIAEGNGGWLITFSDQSAIAVMNGADGTDGKDGVDGKDGKDGVDGKDGKDGSDGKDGTDGKDGSDGKDGTDGKDGIDGKDGADGKDGKDGKDGVDGKDGKDGADGKDGKDGINGIDGVTPLIKVDQDGFYCVSYDNGLTYTRLTDNNGDYIQAKGEKGEQGEQGEQGEKGEQGISVEIWVNDDDYYVLQFYEPGPPKNIIEDLVTPYTANPKNLIYGITQDDLRHTVTLTMQNGDSYTFLSAYTLPTSIAILTTQPLRLAKGSSASFEFRVNPSSALFNYDVESENCQIFLDQIHSGTRSYITTPTHCRLASVSQVYDEQGVQKQGQYRAVIEDIGNSETYDDQFALVLSLEDQQGKPVEVSSSAFRALYSSNLITEFSFLLKDNSGKVTDDVVVVPNGNNIVIRSPYVLSAEGLIPTWVTNGQKVFVAGVEQQNGITPQNFSSPIVYQVISADGEVNSYTVTVITSNLPVVSIDTPEGTAITSKEEWTTESTISITMPDGSVSYEGKLSIKGRGNTTWAAPKKPYALKLDQGGELLEMPKDRRWVLLANWYDRTLLRNAVSFEIARRTHLEWTPRGQFVELILNGRYVGNYYLCEKIEIDKNRLNLHKMTIDDNEGEAITGGYVMEMDENMDELHTFRSAKQNLPYMFKEPDDELLNEPKLAYMQQFINDLEATLYKSDWLAQRDYAEMLDIDTFIDYFIVCELVQNTESTWPKSTYVYKDMNGKLKAGPVWDCDYATFSTYWLNSAPMESATYYGQLLKDPVFVARLKERWAEYKPQMQTIPDYIDEQARKIKSSAEMNGKIWPISTRVNNDETLPYDDAVALMIKNYNTKLTWFDKWVAGL